MESIVETICQCVDSSLAGKSNGIVTYIIGNNGTGKSRILRRIAEIYDDDEIKSVRSIACISNGVYDRFPMRGNRISYLGVRSAPNAVFHGAIDRELVRHVARGIAHGTRFMKRLHDAVGVRIFMRIHAVSSSGAKGKGIAPLQKAIDQRKMKTGSLEDRFSAEQRQWLTDILGSDVDLTRLKKAEAATLSEFLSLNPTTSAFVQKNDTQFAFSDLSSGEQNRLLMAAKIMSSAADRTLILIDEPEISLHLHWQMEFHKDLVEMLHGLKRFHVIVATHSPVLVSEAARSSHDRNNVIVLETRDSTESEVALTALPPGREVSTNSIKSCESLVLDYFDTATFRTRQIVEEVADLVLDATNKPSDSAKILSELQSLLGKKGIERDDIRIVNQAKRLIGQYLGGVNANVS